MFFRKQQFDPPPPTSVLPLHQVMENDYDKKINKIVLPPPFPSPSRPLLPPSPMPPTNEISCQDPCALLNVNMVETPMSQYSSPLLYHID